MGIFAPQVALTVPEWTAIVGAGVALAAMVLSVYSIVIQRAVPYLEAQLVNDLSTGAAAVAIRNSGSRSARAPIVMFATSDGSMYFCSHAGNGFLGPGDGRYLLTTGTVPPIVEGDRTVDALGVVGYFDRRDRIVVRPFGGGRSRKFSSGSRSLIDIFREFHPTAPLENQAALREDRPLA
jgi:hypothetical protein